MTGSRCGCPSALKSNACVRLITTLSHGRAKSLLGERGSESAGTGTVHTELFGRHGAGATPESGGRRLQPLLPLVPRLSQEPSDHVCPLGDRGHNRGADRRYSRYACPYCCSNQLSSAIGARTYTKLSNA